MEITRESMTEDISDIEDMIYVTISEWVWVLSKLGLVSKKPENELGDANMYVELMSRWWRLSNFEEWER